MANPNVELPTNPRKVVTITTPQSTQHEPVITNTKTQVSVKKTTKKAPDMFQN